MCEGGEREVAQVAQVAHFFGTPFPHNININNILYYYIILWPDYWLSPTFLRNFGDFRYSHPRFYPQIPIHSNNSLFFHQKFTKIALFSIFLSKNLQNPISLTYLCTAKRKNADISPRPAWVDHATWKRNSRTEEHPVNVLRSKCGARVSGANIELHRLRSYGIRKNSRNFTPYVMGRSPNGLATGSVKPVKKSRRNFFAFFLRPFRGWNETAAPKTSCECLRSKCGARVCSANIELPHAHELRTLHPANN